MSPSNFLLSDLLQWALTVLGVTYLITDSVIFAAVRVILCRGSLFRTTLIYCPACTGFWVGVASGFLQPDLWISPVQSGLSAMALGRMWAEFFPGKMYQFELTQLGPLQQIEEASHDTQTEKKNV